MEKIEEVTTSVEAFTNDEVNMNYESIDMPLELSEIEKTSEETRDMIDIEQTIEETPDITESEQTIEESLGITDIEQTIEETLAIDINSMGGSSDSGFEECSSHTCIYIGNENSLKGCKDDIVVDLSQVTLLDMAGAKAVQRLLENIVKEGGSVAISGINVQNRAILDKVNNNTDVTVYPTYMDAVEFW